MEIKLRDYQEKAVQDTIKALKESERKRVICEMPTGGGKTVVFSFIVQNASRKKSKTLILTDRTELLRGTGGTLEKFGVLPKYVIAGRKIAPDVNKGDCVVGMAQTLKKRIEKSNWREWFLQFDLIIIDECHKQEFNVFFEKDVFRTKGTVLGFSATPKRGGKQRQLGTDYDKIVHTKTTLELVREGFLCSDMFFGSGLAPDMKDVSLDTKGDYSRSQMFKKYDKAEIYGGLIDCYKKNATDSVMIVFCSSIIHSVRTCKELVENGILARFVSSKMGKPKRPETAEPENLKDADGEWVSYYEKEKYYKEYIEAYYNFSGSRDLMVKNWKAGDFKVMVNCGILTTGFDFPELETVALLRATTSEVLYLQMLGRGSRLADGKTHFNIFDFGKNVERLGSFKLERKWNLYHETSKGGGLAAMKECGEKGIDKNGKSGCGDYVFASASICHCGYVFKQEKEEKKIELQLMTTDNKGKIKTVKPLKDMDFTELEAFQITSNYKIGWLYTQIFLQGGLDYLKKFAKFKNYSAGWINRTYSRIPANLKQKTA